MTKTNINVVVSDEVLAALRTNLEHDRMRVRSDVKRALPIKGVDVTVPDDQDLDTGPHTVSIEEFLEWQVYEASRNRR